MRVMDQFLDFLLAQSIHPGESHPVIARHVRSRDDAFNLHQFGKALRRAFERDFGGTQAGFKIDHAVHLPADAEKQIMHPLDLFRCVRQREADAADPVNVGRHAKKYSPARKRPWE